MLNRSSIENITGLFVTNTEEMPKISTPGERPTYTSLRKFQDKINANAIAIPSHQSLTIGHLGLVIPDAKYAAANNNTSWADPATPALAPRKPATPTGDLTDPFKAQEAIRAWQQEDNSYNTFCLVKEALRKQIIKNVGDQYINALKDDTTLYAQVSPLTILTHLWDNYGEIQSGDMTENEKRMKAPWCPPTPIEDLYKQLREGQVFAAKGGETISEATICRYGLDIIKETGLFEKECIKYGNKDAADKTWSKFQAHWTKVMTNYNQSTTAATARYTAAEVQEIVTNEVAAAVMNTNNTAEPSTEIFEQVQQSANVMTDEHICKLVSACLKANNTNGGGGGRGGGNGNRHGNNGGNERNTKAPLCCQGYNASGEAVTYCWTHGITKNLRHNSTTCQRKAEGHKDDATLNNKMGGNEATCEKKKRE